MILSKAIIAYMDYVSVTKLKGTYNFYTQYLSVINDILGDYECDEITNNLIVSLIKSQKERNPEITNAT